MSEQLTITITARDGASQVFRVVGQSAQQMGRDLDRAGSDGAKGMEDLGRSAETSAESMQRLKDQATAVGAVIGVVASAVMTAGAAFRDQERQVDGINRLYGEQADAILQMSEQIQAFTRFSNDAARESALVASSLATNYDLTADQIQTLIERSADLAQIFGMDLVDAVQRTAGAIRGEGEAAERLGLNMSDAAIAARALEAGIVGWSVPGALSEAEKAAFRFQVFLDDTADTTGAAAAAADTAGGSFRQLANEAQDVMQSFGGALGPIGEVGAELAPLALLAPIITTSLGRLAPVLRSVALASAAFVATPLGLALTAVAGAVTLATIAFGRHGDDIDEAKQAYEDLQEAIQTTDDTIRNLSLQGEFGLATRLRQDIDDARSAMDAYEADLAKVLEFGDAKETAVEEWDNFLHTELGQRMLLFAQGEGWLDAAAETLNTTSYELTTEILNGNVDAIEAARPYLRDAASAYYEELGLTDEDRAAVETAMQPLFDLYSNPNINVDRLDAEITRLFDAFEAKKITAEELQSSLTDLFQNITTGADSFDILDTKVRGLTESQRELKWMLDDMRLDGEGPLADTLQALNDLYVDLGITLDGDTTKASAYAAAQDRINQAVADGTVDGDRMLAYMTMLQQALIGGKIDYEQYADAVITAADNLPLFAAGAQEAALSVAELGEEMSAAGEIVSEALDAMHEAALEAYAGIGQAATEGVEAAIAANEALVESLSTGWEAGTEGIEAYGDALRELQGRMMALGGFDTPLAQIDTSGITGGMDSLTDIAEQTLIVGNALENTFRIVISNVEAMGQSAQGTLDFLEELFTLNEEGFSQADTLLNEGRLSWEQYTAAAEAYTSVAADNYAIQQDLLAIQAQQAPMLATLTAQQQDYIERLRQMPADQQAIALGWMDATTAAQAYEAVALAGAVANGELGSSGEMMFQQMITGAVAANPVLGEMLEQMGLISIGADGTITLHLDGFDGANTAIENLNNSIDALITLLGGVPPVRIDAETEAAQAEIDAIVASIAAADGLSANVSVQGDGSHAQNSIAAVSAALGGLDGQTGTVYALGVNSGATSAIRGAQTALANLDGDTATVYINAVNNAGAAIGSVAAMLNALDGRTATTYVQTVNLGTVGGGVGSLFQHGGVAGYATGGVTARMGEAGPELLHFPGGGTAWAPADSLYTVPMGTLVTPAPASKSAMGGGGITITVHVAGHVIGVDDLAAEITGPIMAGLAAEKHRRDIALGIGS